MSVKASQNSNYTVFIKVQERNIANIASSNYLTLASILPWVSHDRQRHCEMVMQAILSQLGNAAYPKRPIWSSSDSISLLMRKCQNYLLLLVWCYKDTSKGLWNWNEKTCLFWYPKHVQSLCMEGPSKSIRKTCILRKIDGLQKALLHIKPSSKSIDFPIMATSERYHIQETSSCVDPAREPLVLSCSGQVASAINPWKVCNSWS